MVGSRTIVSDLQRFIAKIRGKEDPTLKIGVENKLDTTDGDYVWALRDINFSVEQGDVLGIIGKNGAGKSTLLKILSKVTTPTTGSIKVKGRIASLLEVGTGFHPELSGKENIFLNGAILGMTKTEIRSKFDEIVDFAGVGKYIDTPVKRYSSGMYVRLAFAVAAHLDPEILIVDEVLAVGDADFQKKALGKMKDISKGQGRTVLFVSHNMAAVKSLCKKGLILKNGKLIFEGSSKSAVEAYHNNHSIADTFIEFENIDDAPGNENIKIKSLKVLPCIGQTIDMDSGIKFCLDFFNFKEGIDLDSTFELLTTDDIKVFHNGCFISKHKDSKKGYYSVEGYLPPFLLNAGSYKINLIFGENQRYVLYYAEDILSFEVQNTHTEKGSNLNKFPGIIFTNLNWTSSFRIE